MHKKIYTRSKELMTVAFVLMSFIAHSQTTGEDFILSYPPKAQQAYVQAKALLFQKKYEEAFHAFNGLYRYKFSYDTPFWKWYLQAQVARGEYDSAIHVCTSLIQHEPKNGTFHYWKGLVHLYELNSADGLLSLRKAKELLHEKNELLDGLLLMSEGKPCPTQYFTDYLTHHPNDSVALYFRVSNYIFDRDIAKAHADLETMKTLYPTHSFTVTRVVYILQIEKKYAEALSAITPYAKKNSLFARFLRGRVYFAINQANAALADFRSIVKRLPFSTPIYMSLGACHTVLRSYDSAFYYLNQVTEAKNRDLALYSMAIEYKSNIYYLKGDYDQALATLDKALATSGRKEKIYQSYAAVLLKKQLPDKAKTYYLKSCANRKLVRFDSISLYTFDAAAAILQREWKQGIEKLDEAQKLYNLITEKNVQDIRLHEMMLYWRGYAALELERYDDAKQYLEQSLLILPDQKLTKDLIARCQAQREKASQPDEAPTIVLHYPVLRSDSDNVPLVIGNHSLRGEVVHPVGIASVMMNNKPVTLNEKNSFEFSTTITKGINMFTLVAVSKKGTMRVKNILIEGVEKAEEPVSETALPTYHAVLIAESTYQDEHLPKLYQPSDDARDLYNIITKRYSFEPKNVDTLFNAPRLKILETLISHANRLTEKENLLVFYAGHGTMVQNPDRSEDGYLVPSDAEASNIFSLISREDLTHCFKFSKAKHILFIADACFAGALFRSAPLEDNMSMSVVNAYKDKSRRLLASGNRTVVYDESDFIENLRLQLQENKEKYITTEMLIDRFKIHYENQSGLSLQYYPMKDTGDFGGHFVFVQQ